MKTEKLHYVWEYRQRDRDYWIEHFEGRLPRKIFDAHIHVSRSAFHWEPMTETMRRQFWVNEVNEPLTAEELDSADALVYPDRKLTHLIFGSPSRLVDTDANNEYVSAESAKRNWPALALLIPQWDQKKIEQELDRPNVVGFKPYYAMIGKSTTTRDEFQEANIFDFLPHRALEVLNDRKGWVTLHVPKAARLGEPNNIAQIKELRRRYPDITLVIAHIGRCYAKEQALEGILPLADDEGLYFDTSAVLNPEAHAVAFRAIGPDRLLYGSDNPIFYMRGRRQLVGTKYVNRTDYPFYFNKTRESAEIEKLYTLMMYEDINSVLRAMEENGVGDSASIEKVFYANACRLLGRVCDGKWSAK